MKNRSAVTPPPIEPEIQESKVNQLSDSERQDALLKLIRKGAPSIPRPETFEEEDKPTKFTLRFPQILAERMKQAADDRPVNTPLNTWIIEAILEKLKREGF
jgi:hypothetical protein